jgi:hypothetical protein
MPFSRNGLPHQGDNLARSLFMQQSLDEELQADEQASGEPAIAAPESFELEEPGGDFDEDTQDGETDELDGESDAIANTAESTTTADTQTELETGSADCHAQGFEESDRLQDPAAVLGTEASLKPNQNGRKRSKQPA